MVRKKQQNPYHGTKEYIDTMENTTPLVANIISLPQRPFPPLLRFALIINKSEDPEGTKNKLLDEGLKYELTQGDDIQRSLREMSVLELRTALKDLGLKVNGKKQDLVNRLVGAQSTRGKDKNSKKESKTQKVKGIQSPQSPPTATSPSRTPPTESAKQSEETNTTTEQEKFNNGTEDSTEKKEVGDTKVTDNISGETPRLSEVKEAKDDDDDDEDEIDSKETELRAELRKRGLSTAGRKGDLADRLEADIATNSGKILPNSDEEEKPESSSNDATHPVLDSSDSSESSPVSPTSVTTTSVSTPPVSSPPTGKSSPSKPAKRRDRELNSIAAQVPEQKVKRRSNAGGGVIDSEEEEDSDVVDDDDTDEYDDAESRRKKKVEGPKSTKGSKGKGSRRDAISMRTAKRRRRDF